MTTQIPHFIDGKRTAGQSTRSADVFNPSTGQVQAKVPMAGKADVDPKGVGRVESAAPRAGDDAVRRAGQRPHR
jgi:malonate-semialdehyde dehydrogenase (acetylating) / methylmalonate-semialdehyde dehydrogenase